MDFVTSRNNIHNHNNNTSGTATRHDQVTVPRSYRNKMSNLMFNIMNQKPIKHVTDCTTATIRKTLSYPTSNYSNTNHNKTITRYDLLKAASDQEHADFIKHNRRRTRTRRSSN